MAKVISLGIIIADALAKPIDNYPEKGTLMVFDQLEFYVGGCAANTAVTLARLGVDVMLAGKVGDDVLGRFVTEMIKNAGVDVSGVLTSEEHSTSFSFVMIGSDGERAFLHNLGANATFSLADVDQEEIKRAHMLHIGGNYLLSAFNGAPLAELLTFAKEQDVITSLDTVYNDRVEDWLAPIESSLPYIDYFLPSLIEAHHISGLDDYREIARFFRDRGVGTVGLKMGLAGSYVLGNEGEVHVPIYPVETVDATGAGDCWAGGFLAGVLKGWSLLECARFGNAVAALNCLSVGACAGVKSFARVRAFQRQQEAR